MLKLELLLEVIYTMQEQTNRLYSLQDAAGLLGGTSVWTIRAHIRRGSIVAVHLGTRVYLSADEVARVLREGLPSLKSARQRTPGGTEHERCGSGFGTETVRQT